MIQTCRIRWSYYVDVEAADTPLIVTYLKSVCKSCYKLKNKQQGPAVIHTASPQFLDIKLEVSEDLTESWYVNLAHVS
jgi:hypothetical protein